MSDPLVELANTNFLVTQEMYSEETGLSAGIIRGLVARRELPTIKLGRYRMINKGAIWLNILKEMNKETVPVSGSLPKGGGRECKKIRRGSAQSVDTANLLS